jgi:hypothetical protein
MRTFGICVLLALTGITNSVFGQTAAPLPKTMSGHWTVVVPGRQTYTDTMSVTLDVPSGTGPLTGRLTSHGVICGALDEPLTGTWDGTELRFESQVRPNVNTQRMGGECGSGKITFVLTRKPGQDRFEGESHREAPFAPAQITLAP